MDALLIKSFLPEIFLSLSILAQLLFNIRIVTTLKYNYPIIDLEAFSQTVFILFCLFCLLINLKLECFFTTFIFLNNEGNRLIKILLIFSSLCAILPIYRAFIAQKLNFFEFFSIFLFAILSLLLLTCAHDLMSAYLCIEMQALCFYILASFRRTSAISTEAGLKYFISGSFISCFFLLGTSFIYGTLGTTNFNAISLLLSFSFLETNSFNFFIIIGSLLITITLLFKVSAVPFHFWTPDVYEGAPLSSTIIFAIIPKIVLFTFLIKWIFTISNVIFEIKDLFLISGVLSILFGTFFSLQQKRIKRFIIYSSIAQVGFLIVALAGNTLDGYSSIIFFLLIYILTAILVWGHFGMLYFFEGIKNKFYLKPSVPLFLSNLSNLFSANKVWSLSFVIIFFSIAGIPPLSGFLSKVMILIGLLEKDQIIIVTIIAILSTISVFYYIRVIKIIFFEISKKKSHSLSTLKTDFLFRSESFLFTILIFLLVYIFFYPDIFLLFSQYLILSILGF